MNRKYFQIKDSRFTSFRAPKYPNNESLLKRTGRGKTREWETSPEQNHHQGDTEAKLRAFLTLVKKSALPSPANAKSRPQWGQSPENSGEVRRDTHLRELKLWWRWLCTCEGRRRATVSTFIRGCCDQFLWESQDQVNPPGHTSLLTLITAQSGQLHWFFLSFPECTDLTPDPEKTKSQHFKGQQELNCILLMGKFCGIWKIRLQGESQCSLHLFTHSFKTNIPPWPIPLSRLAISLSLLLSSTLSYSATGGSEAPTTHVHLTQVTWPQLNKFCP